MNSIERRLRELERRANLKPPRPVRHVIVDVGDTLEAVLEREGIVPYDGPEIDVIAHVLVAPGTAAAAAALAGCAGQPDRKAGRRAIIVEPVSNGADGDRST